MSLTYIAQLNPEAERDIDGELSLMGFGTSGSILYIAISLLGGNSLRAQRTVEYPGIQYGQNVSSRNEITRWFGVSILVLLYFPQVVTSGIDNDWGFGINPLNESWICDSTLRISPTYISVKFLPMLAVIITAVVVTLISWSIQPLLWFIVSKVRDGKVPISIRRGLITQNLHSLLQLHRMAIQQISDYKFSRTWDTIPRFEGTNSMDVGKAPLYGVSRFFSEQESVSRDQEDHMNMKDESKVKDLHATLLRSRNEAEEIYDIGHVR